VSCGRSFPPDAVRLTCEDCGPLRGTLDAVYDWKRAEKSFHPRSLKRRRDRSVWRYAEILPVGDPGAERTLPVGLTPLIPLPAEPGTDPRRTILVKDDRLPSFKLFFNKI